MNVRVLYAFRDSTTVMKITLHRLIMLGLKVMWKEHIVTLAELNVGISLLLLLDSFLE